ncbi:hypothetical protein FRC07_004824 [Ceratobasidium sp. 392]|nr:hypothetical protein FRC07_004824 [Ceratobasidium sp. 392]
MSGRSNSPEIHPELESNLNKLKELLKTYCTVEDLRPGYTEVAEEIDSLANEYYGVQSRSRMPTMTEPRQPEAKEYEPELDSADEDLLSEFFYTLWNTLIDFSISGVEIEVIKCAHLITILQVLRPKPDANIEWGKLPFLGQCVRDIYNFPIDTTGFVPAALLPPEMQDVLAGAHLDPVGEALSSLAQQRRRWLNLQRFLAMLWVRCNRGEFTFSYALYAIWAVRDGLEDWPESPPSSDSEPDSFEASAAYLALNVEAASIWITWAGRLMYKETRVWGQNGNPDWPACSGAPGMGGERWQGVDGYDAEHKRWDLWKEVLQIVLGWYEKESEGKMKKWEVEYGAKAALRQMEAVEKKYKRSV